MQPAPPPSRGATLNDRSGRFNLASREEDGDWRDTREDVDGEPPPVRTTVTNERPRTIITRNNSPDIAFDRSINAYRGCEHGCIYCFARPTHAYHDLSPGIDFETKLFAKPAAPELLRAELAKPSYVPSPIAMGTNTDPYQPIEREWRITRQCLEVLRETRHPVTITTKSARVTRDLDLLADMAADGLVMVALSVTSLDPRTARGRCGRESGLFPAGAPALRGGAALQGMARGASSGPRRKSDEHHQVDPRREGE
jgi:hypothetical protein